MSIWALVVHDCGDGRAVCAPLVNGAPHQWRAAPWGALLGASIADAWSAGASVPVDVAEMRAFAHRMGLADIDGVLVMNEALGLLLDWFGCDSLEMVVHDGAGLIFSDGQSVAHMPGLRLLEKPALLPCRACGAAPALLPVPISVSCACGLRSPVGADADAAARAWNEHCGAPWPEWPTWRWSRRTELAERRPGFAPVPLAWFDGEGNGPTTFHAVAVGLGVGAGLDLGDDGRRVMLSLPGSGLDGAAALSARDLVALRNLADAAIAWVGGSADAEVR